MKTSHILLVAALLAGAASIAAAGQSSQFANQTPKATPNRVVAMAANEPVISCPGCKTEELRDARQVGSPKSGPTVGAVVGAKHTCTHCDGEVKAVSGKVTNAMPNSCPMCGPQASHCVNSVLPAKT